jgi:hypothetical protein
MHISIKDIYMNTLGKFAIKMGLVSLLSVLPLAAQVDNGVVFSTAFPFYAGSTKLPAGSYKITQADPNADVLQIRSTEGNTSVYVNFMSTDSTEPFGKTTVSFQQYDGTDYLDRVSIEGETDGAMIDPTKAEVKAAAEAKEGDRFTVTSGQ